MWPIHHYVIAAAIGAVIVYVLWLRTDNARLVDDLVQCEVSHQQVEEVAVEARIDAEAAKTDELQ